MEEIFFFGSWQREYTGGRIPFRMPRSTPSGWRSGQRKNGRRSHIGSVSEKQDEELEVVEGEGVENN